MSTARSIRQNRLKPAASGRPFSRAFAETQWANREPLYVRLTTVAISDNKVISTTRLLSNGIHCINFGSIGLDGTRATHTLGMKAETTRFFRISLSSPHIFLRNGCQWPIWTGEAARAPPEIAKESVATQMARGID